MTAIDTAAWVASVAGLRPDGPPRPDASLAEMNEYAGDDLPDRAELEVRDRPMGWAFVRGRGMQVVRCAS